MAFFGNDVIRVTPDDPEVEFYLQGILNTDMSRNSSINQPDTPGPYGARSTIGSQQPSLSFSTQQIKQAIEQVPLNGLCFEDGAVTPGFVAYGQKHDRCNTDGRASGSTHMAISSTKGHLLVDTIGGSAGSNVVANLMAHALSADGETNPLAFAFNASLPAPALDTQAWRIGGIVIGGTYIDEVTSFSIAYNHQFAKPVHADHPYPQKFDWQKMLPVVNVTFDVPETIHGAGGLNLPPLGSRVASADTYLQLRRVDASTGAPEPTGSSVHLRCAINALLHSQSPFSASGASGGSVSVTFTTEETASANPLVWSVDQTMTTS